MTRQIGNRVCRFTLALVSHPSVLNTTRVFFPRSGCVKSRSDLVNAVECNNDDWRRLSLIHISLQTATPAATCVLWIASVIWKVCKLGFSLKARVGTNLGYDWLCTVAVNCVIGGSSRISLTPQKERKKKKKTHHDRLPVPQVNNKIK